MEKILCPSMMCADFSNLETEVQALDKAGIDIFHMDIMDGGFVPNFGMGLQDYATIRQLSDKPLDVHLMIQKPGRYIDLFAELGADLIYIHPEADQQPARTLVQIKNKGKKAGLALNPDTGIETITELLPLVDYILVMTVFPGFSGQPYLNFVDKKIDKLVRLNQVHEFKIVVDGAISPEKVQQLSNKGVHGFVLGTSALFGKQTDYSTIIQQLRA